jgi:hypothetical protein
VIESELMYVSTPYDSHERGAALNRIIEASKTKATTPCSAWERSAQRFCSAYEEYVNTFVRVAGASSSFPSQAAKAIYYPSAGAQSEFLRSLSSQP